jgi:hypothetical protein
MPALVAALMTVLLLGATLPAEAAAGPKPKVVAIGKDPVEASPEPHIDTAKVGLTLLDAGTVGTNIEVKLDATSSGEVSVRDYEPSHIEPNGATRVKVTLQGLDTLKDKPVEGQLVVTGGAEPVARTVSMKRPLEPSTDWPAKIFIIAGIAFLFSTIAVLAWVLIAALVAEKATKHPVKNGFKAALKTIGGPAPGPKWSFSSWASTLTAVGGVFGTVLTSKTLPEVPEQIEENALIQLNLAFAALVAVGPLIFQAIRNPFIEEKDRELGLWGFSPVLLFSYALTCAAVIGQLASLALLGWEVAGGHQAKVVVVTVVCLLAGLALVYFVLTTHTEVATDWAKRAKEAKKAASEPQKVEVVGPRRGAAHRTRRPRPPHAERPVRLVAPPAPIQLQARMP